MTILAFLQYILAAIALTGLVAYGLTRWVIYIIVWQPWVKVVSHSRPMFCPVEKTDGSQP